MSSTVIAALITAITGFAGASVGTFFAAKTANAARKNDYRKFLFEKRLQAYQAFSTTYSEYIKANSSAEAYLNFLAALQLVYLVASDETYSYASKFSLCVCGASPEERASQEFHDLRHDLLQSFRTDLLDFKVK